MKGLRDHDRRAGTAAGRALLPLSPHSGLLGSWPPPPPSLSPLHKPISTLPLPLSPSPPHTCPGPLEPKQRAAGSKS